MINFKKLIYINCRNFKYIIFKYSINIELKNIYEQFQIKTLKLLISRYKD
jgi:hypothetical protein